MRAIVDRQKRDFSFVRDLHFNNKRSDNIGSVSCLKLVENTRVVVVIVTKLATGNETKINFAAPVHLSRHSVHFSFSPILLDPRPRSARRPNRRTSCGVRSARDLNNIPRAPPTETTGPTGSTAHSRGVRFSRSV